MKMSIVRLLFAAIALTTQLLSPIKGAEAFNENSSPHERILPGSSEVPLTAKTLRADRRLMDSRSGSPNSTRQAQRPQIAAATGGLYFEPNGGQTDAQVKFLARQIGRSVFLTEREVVISLTKNWNKQRFRPAPDRITPVSFSECLLERESNKTSEALLLAPESAVVRMSFVNGNTAPRPAGWKRVPGESNYFLNNDGTKATRHLAHYAGVAYENIYPGIDFTIHGNETGMIEYDFTVAPGSDPSVIAMHFSGVKQQQIGANGDLVLTTKLGQVRHRLPRVYQLDGDLTVSISARYVQDGRGNVRFAVGDYDKRKPLVIDPVITYAMHLGGLTGHDFARGVAMDAAGNAYVVGFTDSRDFPIAQARQSNLGGASDAFISKITPGGTIAYSTYLGGSGVDQATAVAVDAAGNAYLTGSAGSGSFPTTPGAFQPTYSGGPAFAAKISPDGATLLYSTFIGGSGNQLGWSIALGPNGTAYVAGYTNSKDFPTTPSAYRATRTTTDVEAFLVALSPDGSSLIYGTYFGGSNTDSAQGVAVDPAGDAVISGYTFSQDLPTTPGAFQQTFGGGGGDIFAAKFSPTGSLVYATYAGGSDYDFGDCVATDASGNAYLGGYTHSTDYPVTPGSLKATHAAGDYDAVVTKLDPTGTNLIYSTLLGGNFSTGPTGQGGPGSGTEEIFSIVIDQIGSAYLTGYTSSSDFPVTPDAVQLQKTSGTNPVDGFFLVLHPSGRSVVYGTYLGGIDDDTGYGVAITPDGGAVLAGATSSPEFATETPRPTGPPNAGAHDAFVLKIAGVPAVPSVVSRKTHGAAGTFDITLPVSGDPGIECRDGGANGDHQLVFTFPNPVTVNGTPQASVTAAKGGTVSSVLVNNEQVTVNLTGVGDGQTITVTLNNVNNGANTSVSMGLLLGDTTANKNVSNTDVASVKGQVAAPVDPSNFRTDVNANGIISNTDVSSTKAEVGTSLP
jgi:hypothetical protein